jgi:hypothetical protein
MSAYEYYHNWNLRNVDLAQTLEHYLMRGFGPGGFTTAVLANDLFGAVAKADHWNKPAIVEIAQEIARTCPAHAYGSYEAVRAWINDKDNCRSKYATWKMLQGPVTQAYDEEVPF